MARRKLEPRWLIEIPKDGVPLSNRNIRLLAVWRFERAGDVWRAVLSSRAKAAICSSILRAAGLHGRASPEGAPAKPVRQLPEPANPNLEPYRGPRRYVAPV